LAESDQPLKEKSKRYLSSRVLREKDEDKKAEVILKLADKKSISRNVFNLDLSTKAVSALELLPLSGKLSSNKELFKELK